MLQEKSKSELQAFLLSEGSYGKAVNTLLRKTVVDNNNVDDDDDTELLTPAFEQRLSVKCELQSLQKTCSKMPCVTTKILNLTLKRDRVLYREQAAADTGGVIRQFYTQLLNAISNTFFQGETHRSPIYDSEVVASGIMKLVGTIIVHSILQGGPGFPVSSLAVYHYLAKGDVQEAVRSMTVGSCSMQMKDLI